MQFTSRNQFLRVNPILSYDAGSRYLLDFILIITFVKNSNVSNNAMEIITQKINRGRVFDN